MELILRMDWMDLHQVLRLLIATFFTVAAIGMGHNDLAAGIWPVSCATVGSLLGFLVF